MRVVAFAFATCLLRATAQLASHEPEAHAQALPRVALQRLQPAELASAVAPRIAGAWQPQGQAVVGVKQDTDINLLNFLDAQAC